MTPLDRIKYSGNIEELIHKISDIHNVGHVKNYSIIETGYEDCNIIIETNEGKYVTKIFSKNRSKEDILRYCTIMEKAVDAGVNHPTLIKTREGAWVGQAVEDVFEVLMNYVDGKTFYQSGSTPNKEELNVVLEQAAKINRIDHHPKYLFDSWAIPNIQVMYERIRQYIEPHDAQLVVKAIDNYLKIPVADLPHCFLHGDFTKANVLKGNDGKIYILDFSVSNWYPRIQELAVIAANLLHDEKHNSSLRERCNLVYTNYILLNPLTNLEHDSLFDYSVAGLAMELLGSYQERFVNGNDNEETRYWYNLGREGLREALN